MTIDMEQKTRALRAILTERGLKHVHVAKRGKALTISTRPPR